MPLDPSYVGHSYPPTTPYLVSREKIREFADAIGAPEAAYRDPAAARSLGYPDVIAPPTFPIVLTALAGQDMVNDPGLGLDFSRVVHGDQRFRYVRPVHAGDLLRCVLTVEAITSRGGHDLLTSRTEISGRDAGPVLTAWTMFVVRGE